MAKPINLEVRLKDGEDSLRLIKRFLKKLKKQKITEEYLAHNHYVKPSLRRREEKKKRKRVLEKLKRENNR
jgi:ribosomal protein S21